MPLGARLISEVELKHFTEIKMNIKDFPNYSDLAYNNQPEFDFLQDKMEHDINMKLS